MDKVDTLVQFEIYIDGWKANNKEQILSVLHKNCRIVECYGPQYEGITQVNQWLEDWISKGHYVKRWDIIQSYFDVDHLSAIFEWEFECFANHRAHFFKGNSVVKYKENLILDIKEYRMEPHHYFPYECK